MTNETKVLVNYRRMRNLRRCNNYPLINSMDVAQHSYNVTVLAMVFADEYNISAADKNVEFHPFDVENQLDLAVTEEVLRKAILHDTDEVVTGDIFWTVKHYTPEFNREVSKVTEEISEHVYQDTSTIFRQYQEWSHGCKDGLEGAIVDMADMVELALFCLEELSMGNSNIRPLYDKAVSLLPEKRLFNELMELSPTFNDIYSILIDVDENKEKLSELYAM